MTVSLLEYPAETVDLRPRPTGPSLGAATGFVLAPRGTGLGDLKPYEFIGFGAVDVTKSDEFIRFEAMNVTNLMNL